MDKIIVKKIDEVIYHETLESGLEVYVYKKPNFNKKNAYFVTKYGSSNNEFIPFNKDKLVSFPKGIAHFLEHKLFESDDNESTFLKFENYGSYVNAYTNHTETCYYFSTSNHFYECLNLLMDFVMSPYFTDENVEKEKGIINQEINMCDDNISRFMYEKAFEVALKNNPNKYKTIGDKENVSKITKDDLYECYNTFYHPSNMILTISGDVDVKKTIAEVKRNMEKRNFKRQEKIKLPEYIEEKEVNKKYERVLRNVSTPRLSICYKIIIPKLKGYELLKKSMLFEFILNIKFGSTSSFRQELIDNNIIKSKFSYDFSRFDDVVLLMFSSDVIDEEKFIKCLDDKLKDNNYDEKIFYLNKKADLASIVRSYDNPSFIASKIYTDIINYGEFLNDIYDIYEKYEFGDFINDVKKLDFSNKSVVYVTGKKEE